MTLDMAYHHGRLPRRAAKILRPWGYWALIAWMPGCALTLSNDFYIQDSVVDSGQQGHTGGEGGSSGLSAAGGHSSAAGAGGTAGNATSTMALGGIQTTASGDTASGGAQSTTGGDTTTGGMAPDTGGTAGVGGAVSTTGGATSSPYGPVCSVSVAKGNACTDATGTACYKTCGPSSVGYKSEICQGGSYVEQANCSFPVGPDYSCYKIPAHLPAECPAGTIPQANQSCQVAQCIACWGGPTGTPTYADSTGTQKNGYCVCADAGTWTCGSFTAWPCPGSAGCS